MLSAEVVKGQLDAAHLRGTKVKGPLRRGRCIEDIAAVLMFLLTTAACVNGLAMFVRLEVPQNFKRHPLHVVV